MQVLKWLFNEDCCKDEWFRPRKIWDINCNCRNGSHTIVVHFVHEFHIEIYIELTSASNSFVHVLVIGLVVVLCIIRSSLSLPEHHIEVKDLVVKHISNFYL
jgi:hypothetical protein